MTGNNLLRPRFALLAHWRLSSAAGPNRAGNFMLQQVEFILGSDPSEESSARSFGSLAEELAAFRQFGEATRVLSTKSQSLDGEPIEVETYVNEFWTSKQRAAHPLHEISYRACFKPQLPRFFIERLTEAGDAVYDPFMGRGTTLLEAALLERVPFGCDVNPLSRALVGPRLNPPSLEAVGKRLSEIDLTQQGEAPDDLLVFYHPETLREIAALKKYLLAREASGQLDAVDSWIRMTAINRLTGHSPGFFSVYSLPPNQAVSVKSQRKINEKRNQTPPQRDIAKLIFRKSRQLLKRLEASEREALMRSSLGASLVTGLAHDARAIPDESVALVVTSPPFLDVVDYAGDNWLRCWFLGVDPATVKISVPKKLEKWREIMTEVLRDLRRVLKPGGHVAFEVGEVRGGKVRLEEAVIPCGAAAGLEPVLVMINDQKFTKTANCWGVDNQVKGTNTNRIVVFRKPGVVVD